MGWQDIGVLAVLGVAVGLSLVLLRRRRRDGCCGGCAGCPQSRDCEGVCGGSCGGGEPFEKGFPPPGPHPSKTFRGRMGK